MNNSMISALVSMNSMQQQLAVISDNVANLDTVGYKRKEGTFEDVLNTVMQQPEDFRQSGRMSPLGYNTGYGMRVSSISQNMEQGPLKATGNPTDLAIEGNGLFAVEAYGHTAYTREGDFHFEPDPDMPGTMVLINNQGYFVLDTEGKHINVMDDSKVAIDEDGNVIESDGTSRTVAATIQLVNPIRPEGLEQMDGNLYVLPNSVTKGQIFGTTTQANEIGTTIRSGQLEQSNVNFADAITTVMQIQRAYQLASRALTSSDTMMGLANNIRG